MSDTAPSPMRCPFCARGDLRVFWTAERMPLFCNVLPSDRQTALDAQRQPIRLGLCDRCGGVYNTAFDASLMHYQEGYENSLHFSPRFQQYAGGLAERLVRDHSIRGKDVVEIGCGNGEFLEMLCRLGNNRGVGFDPSARPRVVGQNGFSMEIIPRLFTAAEAGRPVDFLCCRQVLEHIADPREFLRAVRASIGDRRDTKVFFEVPNALWVLEELGIWDVIYEHCSYFTAPALAGLFAASGFEEITVREEFGRQFLGIECRPAAAGAPPAEDVSAARRMHRPAGAAAAALGELAHRFGEFHRAKVARWRTRLDELHRAGDKAVVWGAGSKGVTFLNVLGLAGPPIEHVVDVHPGKRGRFVPGTGQEVVAPEALTANRPRVVLVMNPLYQEEIAEQLEAMGVAAEVEVV